MKNSVLVIVLLFVFTVLIPATVLAEEVFIIIKKANSSSITDYSFRSQIISEDEDSLHAKLSEVAGVVKCWIEKYSITVERGTAFEQKEIDEAAMKIIKDYFNVRKVRLENYSPP